MSIFRRGKKSDAQRRAPGADGGSATSPGVDPAADPAGHDAGQGEGPGAEPGAKAADPGADLEAGPGVARSGDDDTNVAAQATQATAASGPFDAFEVEDDDGRLDLGALRIVGVPGMELRLEVEEAAQHVVGVTAVLGDSAVQLQAFAAPRTAGIWDAIREEIAASVIGQGGTADEALGELGTELRTRMPSAGPDGRTVFAPARFVGVDGPRWFLRAVFSGRAAIDEQAAAPLMQVVRNTVVVRGETAMAPRELLPLRLPQQAVPEDPQGATEQAGQGGPGGSGQPTGRSADDLNPFERGPEITEVR